MAKKSKKSARRDYSDPMMRAAHEVLTELKDSPLAVEALTGVQRMIDSEDNHWSVIFGRMEHDGLTLEQIHELDEEIRQSIIKSPIMDRGAQLRHSYIWSKGINLPVVETEPSKPGAKPRLHKILNDPTNQRYFFDGGAHEELERGLYTGGNVFALVNKKEGQARRVPVKEIVDLLTNPDFGEEIWAWQREWQHTNKAGADETMKVWYYTDDCPLPRAKRPKKIADVDVDHDQVFVVHSVNRQIGWPLGIPDAIAAVAWAKLYSEFLKHGYVMSRALASIAFRATVGSKSSGENASMKMADTKGAGNTAVMGAANSLTALPTAGRGYDFDSGRPIAAMVATAVQVSVVHLLSDPGAAGSSYGASQNLDLPTRRAVVSRQESWVAFFQRLIAALGAPGQKVTFPPFDEPDPYRALQSIVVGWSTGTLHIEEVRARLLDLLEIVTTETKAPDGVLLPNNADSLARRDIDRDGTGGTGGGGNDQKSGQGHSSGAGKGPNANDIRQDGQGQEAQRALEALEVREMLGTILAAIESGKGAR
jgi:hypothetical protein